MKPLAFVASLTIHLTCCYFPLMAQSEPLTQEQKDQLIASVGKDVGEALHSTHFAINALADNWRKNTFTPDRAEELATSYKGSAQQVLGLVKGKSPQIERAAEYLLQQAIALETWIQSDQADAAAAYDKIKAVTDAAFLGNSPAAQAVADASVVKEIKHIAETLRDDLGKLAPYKPSREQIETIAASTDDAAKLYDFVEKGFAQLPKGRPAAKPGQSEVLVVGPNLKQLPVGYSRTINHFKPSIEFYGFKYVTPGATLGMSYDALIKVDGNWIFLPKAWRVFALANAAQE